MAQTHSEFSGSVPNNYDRYLGPLIFHGYARDLAARVKAPDGGRVLETAAGTGIATRELRAALPESVAILATDLNQGMIEYAQSKLGVFANVEWRQADAMNLPVDDDEFDAVVSQFGMMFMPDKVAAAREIARVLKHGGSFAFNVWDGFGQNHLVRTVDMTIAGFFPDDPPGFYRTPYGWFDVEEICATLENAGFEDIAYEVLPDESQAPQARHVALGFVTGTPLAAEIAARATDVTLDDLVEAVTEAVAAAHGDKPCRAKMQAIVFTARKPG